jgi:hypothetical protein
VGAMSILEQNPDKISWYHLSENANACQLLESNLDKSVNWSVLSTNVGAMSILEQNQDKIDWKHFSKNPSIFVEVFDYVLK